MTQSRSLLQKLVLSVPATAAYCVLARTLKQGGPFVGERPSVTLIEVSDERWLETFEQAAGFYIRATRTRPRPSEDGYEGDAKIVVREKGHLDRLGKEMIVVASSYRRVLVLVAKGDEIRRDVRISADAAVTLPLPTWRDLAVACRIGRQTRISRADAEFLATCPPDDIRLALRLGRDVADGIASLRTHAAVSAAPRRVAVTEAPTLLELSGYGEAKDWGLDLARDLSDWKEGSIPWADVDRGVLLSGPPGCGKTVFASALGRTCDVPVVFGSLANWQAKGHMGDLLKAMRRGFDDARSKTPSILFLDEFDSIGDREKFTGDNAQYCTEVVNGLLECMDGAEGREGVVIVGACNHPDRIDAAFMRPGRLERHIRIPLPDAASRLAISGTISAERWRANPTASSSANRRDGPEPTSRRWSAAPGASRARNGSRSPQRISWKPCRPARHFPTL